MAGLYDPPTRSIKFGRSNPYSLLPVGWSHDGNVAILIHQKEIGEAWLVIIDAVEDKVLFRSDTYTLGDNGIVDHWVQSGGDYSEKLADASILPDPEPLYGGIDFTVGNDTYNLYRESDPLPGNRGIAGLSLMIRSEFRGWKKLYSYVHNGDDDSILMDFSVLGYFRSPHEKRIIVISLEDNLDRNGESELSLRFNGAHLGLGYTLEKNNRTRLVGAVLSGQFYMARSILEEGQDPHIKAPGGEALIIMAARQNNWDIVFLLLEYGAEAALVDEEGRTLLHLAALDGDRDAVVKLLTMGLNSNYADLDGKLPRDLALEAGHSPIAELLGN